MRCLASDRALYRSKFVVSMPSVGRALRGLLFADLTHPEPIDLDSDPTATLALLGRAAAGMAAPSSPGSACTRQNGRMGPCTPLSCRPRTSSTPAFVVRCTCGASWYRGSPRRICCAAGGLEDLSTIRRTPENGRSTRADTGLAPAAGPDFGLPSRARWGPPVCLLAVCTPAERGRELDPCADIGRLRCGCAEGRKRFPDTAPVSAAPLARTGPPSGCCAASCPRSLAAPFAPGRRLPRTVAVLGLLVSVRHDPHAEPNTSLSPAAPPPKSTDTTGQATKSSSSSLAQSSEPLSSITGSSRGPGCTTPSSPLHTRDNRSDVGWRLTRDDGLTEASELIDELLRLRCARDLSTLSGSLRSAWVTAAHQSQAKDRTRRPAELPTGNVPSPTPMLQ
mmetsp:Transcript_60775/g.163067  ORF Transcript_60775/g.163067 Transcript_60775/m.163067 type:complete len:393 (+) Transcript_60775:166-1344(+)